MYFTLVFNFSFSFNLMHVKSYNKTFQNACATRLNKSWSSHIFCHCSFLKVSSRSREPNIMSRLVS